MSRQNQIYVLIGLLLIAAYAFYSQRSEAPGTGGVLASDASFHPLNVDEPHLRLDVMRDLLHPVRSRDRPVRLVHAEQVVRHR